MIFAEAKYNGKWYHIDYFTTVQDGKPRYPYLFFVSRSFLGQLSSVVDYAIPLKFQALSESTRSVLQNGAQPQYEASTQPKTFFHAEELHDFEAFLNAPYEYEHLVTRNQEAALEPHQNDSIPYKSGILRSDLRASMVRAVYCIS
mgnify:FL=1